MKTGESQGRPWAKWALIGLAALFLGVMLVLPLIYILTVAFREGVGVFIAAITQSDALKAVLLTLGTMLVTVAVNTLFGLFAAWCLTKYAFRGKRVLSALIDLPVTLSPVTAGLIYLLTYGRQSILYPLLQRLGITIVFAVPGVILATIFVTFPLVSRELIPVLSAQGTQEEEAAALMGAGTWTIFRRVTFPHIRWALLYGVVLCAARAMGEFGAVSVVSGHLSGKTNTLPLYIELLYQGYDFTGAFAVSALLVVMSVIILILRSLLERKGDKARNAH
ncbi:MAG: sulfate ABC transporter permease subunit CysW [Oscillospiraceae bacterium]|nr:sulfate ABC transporter permease subunit CysW [Oscillospiraceae bacterium]